MFVNDYNLLLIIFHLLLTIFLVSLTSSLGLLIIAELVWIILYVLTALNGVLNDDVTLLALPFLFLIFSAVELGFGLLLLTLQLQVARTLSLSGGSINKQWNSEQQEPFYLFK